jgi:hypothetical protein
MGTGNICLKGDCSAFSTFTTFTASTVSATTCSNILSSVTITLTLTSTGTVYQLSSATVASNYEASVAHGTTVNVAVNVVVNNVAVAVSGSPGYQVGKAVKMVSAIPAIGDADGNCRTTAAGSLPISFGVAQTFSCKAVTPCTTAYIVDTIGKSTISVQKYASKSSDLITVSGTSATLNTCNS